MIHLFINKTKDFSRIQELKIQERCNQSSTPILQILTSGVKKWCTLLHFLLLPYFKTDT